MSVKTYKITLTVKTGSKPTDILDFVSKRIKDALPVFSIDYDLVEERETTIEHHGGITNEEE